MTKINYWKSVDEILHSLVKNGHAKLPSLSVFDLESLAENISAEMRGATFAESCPSHKSFLEDLDLNNALAPKLFEIAKNKFGYKGKISNQYHIARRVEPGDSKEMYRAHFDSHLFTMVLPIKIPEAKHGGAVGDLIYFPNARKPPKSEISNTFSKALHKRYASKHGLEVFAKSHEKNIDNFIDYSPLLFIGNSTLHTNKQVSLNCSSYRLTLLAHFFDPSPRYGVGGILRKLRNR